MPWDLLRWRPAPEGLTHKEWWLVSKLARVGMKRILPLTDTDGQGFSYALPDEVLRGIEYVDKHTSGRIRAPGPVTEGAPDRARYVINSLIEEAITSSQLVLGSRWREVATKRPAGVPLAAGRWGAATVRRASVCCPRRRSRGASSGCLIAAGVSSRVCRPGGRAAGWRGMVGGVCCPCRRSILGSACPVASLAPGMIMWAGYCRCVHADQIRLSPCVVPRAASPYRHGEERRGQRWPAGTRAGRPARSS